jgi:hypothetical protein
LGQKVHPLGFRLVTIQKIRSTWFSEFKNYPELICEDAAIRTFIQNKTKHRYFKYLISSALALVNDSIL